MSNKKNTQSYGSPPKALEKQLKKRSMLIADTAKTSEEFLESMEKQNDLIKKVKDHLNSFCESLTKTVQPLKIAIIAELHIEGDLDEYVLEYDVIELCVVVIEDTINRTQNFIENLRVGSLDLQLKERLNHIERSIARAMTTLQLFARTKAIDYQTNKSLSEIETLSLTVKQIVESIDYESISDAIDVLDECLVVNNLKFPKSALIESNN